MGGKVDDVQMHVAKPTVLGDDLVVNRMAGGPTHLGNGKLCSNTHGFATFPDLITVRIKLHENGE
jgi:hypothetical protein